MSVKRFNQSNINNKEEIVTDNGFHFWFDYGNFDEWCVHCKRPTGKMWFAYDSEYLTWIRRMGKRYGEDRVYNDFVKIYDVANYDFNMKQAYKVIHEVDSNYPYKNNTSGEEWWTYFWMTMVAEERKENAIVGKRIKRLAVHNLLFDKWKLSYVLTYMDTRRNPNMSWRKLDKYCYERGF